MTRYSVQPRDRIFVKGNVFFAKNMDRNIGKNVSKNLSGKYSQKLIDHAPDAFKIVSKRAFKKNSRSYWWFY